MLLSDCRCAQASSLGAGELGGIIGGGVVAIVLLAILAKVIARKKKVQATLRPKTTLQEAEKESSVLNA